MGTRPNAHAPTPAAASVQGAKPRPAPRAPSRIARGGKKTAVLGALIPRLTRPAFERYGFATAQLITDWPEVVGKQLARKCRPTRLKWPKLPGAGTADGPRPGATLHLQVAPAFALEIQYASAQIRERINAYFGYRAVAEIRLTQCGDITAQATTSATNPAADRTRLAAAKPTAPRLDAPLDRVENPRVRNALDALSQTLAAKRRT